MIVLSPKVNLFPHSALECLNLSPLRSNQSVTMLIDGGVTNRGKSPNLIMGDVKRILYDLTNTRTVFHDSCTYYDWSYKNIICVCEFKKVPLLRFQFQRYSDFSKIGPKISLCQFLTFMMVQTLLFQISQTATLSDPPFLLYGGVKFAEIFSLFEAEGCLFFHSKTLKPYFSKHCFSKVQLQNAISLWVLYFGCSERSQSIRNFI